jgi:cytochrome P450
MVVGYILSFLLLLFLYGLNIFNRFKLKHLPGPNYRLFTGSMSDIPAEGYHLFQKNLHDLHGPIVAFFLGRSMNVSVADVDLARSITLNSKDFPARPKAIFSSRENHGLFHATGVKWKRIRNAVIPMFADRHLQHFMHPMHTSTKYWVDALLRWPQDKPLDMHQLFGHLSLSIIVETAFGVPGPFSSPLSADLDPATSSIESPPSQTNTSPGQKERENLGNTSAATTAIYALTTQLASPVYRQRILTAAQAVLSQRGLGLLGTTILLIFPFLAALVDWLPPVYAQLADIEKSQMVLDGLSAQVRSTRRLLQELPSQISLLRPDTFPQTSASAITKMDCSEGKQAVQRCERVNAVPDIPKFSQDFVDLLLQARVKEDGDRLLTEDELRDQSNSFLLAGYETTANTLAFAVFLLARNAGPLSQLLSEIDNNHQYLSLESTNRGVLSARFPFAELCVKETLRLFPPGAALLREAARDTHVSGWAIPCGTKVAISVFSIHRDERYWVEPNSFRPERFQPGSKLCKNPHAFMPFGAGVRSCVGARFAMQELVLVLVELLSRVTFTLVRDIKQEGSSTLSRNQEMNSSKGDTLCHFPSPHQSQAGQSQNSPPPHELRVKSAFTLGPANGVWVTVKPRLKGAVTPPRNV